MPDDEATPIPSTSPRGLAVGDEADLRSLVLGVRQIVIESRSDWETWKNKRDAEKASENHRLDSVVSGLATLNGRMEVIEQDVASLSKDVKTAAAGANEAAERADTAHTLATTASVAAGKVSVDHDAERENNLAILSETRGQLKQAIEAITQLRETDAALKQSDEKLAELVKESAKNSISEVLGKNPKLIAALTAILIVFAQIIGQRFLIPPAAPNQGAFPGETPVVHADVPMPALSVHVDAPTIVPTSDAGVRP